MELQLRKAMDDLGKSMRLDDKPLLSYLHAMDIAKHFGDRECTRALLDAANRLDPKNVIVRRKYLLTLESRWGGSPQHMRDFARECRKQGLPEATVRDFLGMAELDAGRLQHREKRLSDAAASYRAALPLLADPAAAWRGLGFVLTDERKYPEALDSLSRVLDKYPDDAATLSRRGGTYMALQQPALALADYRRAGELGDAHAQNELGKHYWHGGTLARDRQQAIAWLRQAADQGNAEAKTNLSWALRQTSEAPR